MDSPDEEDGGPAPKRPRFGRLTTDEEETIAVSAGRFEEPYECGVEEKKALPPGADEEAWCTMRKCARSALVFLLCCWCWRRADVFARQLHRRSLAAGRHGAWPALRAARGADAPRSAPCPWRLRCRRLWSATTGSRAACTRGSSPTATSTTGCSSRRRGRRRRAPSRAWWWSARAWPASQPRASCCPSATRWSSWRREAGPAGGCTPRGCTRLRAPPEATPRTRRSAPPPSWAAPCSPAATPTRWRWCAGSWARGCTPSGTRARCSSALTGPPSRARWTPPWSGASTRCSTRAAPSASTRARRRARCRWGARSLSSRPTPASVRAARTRGSATC